jgi:hypothetical protein
MEIESYTNKRIKNEFHLKVARPLFLCVQEFKLDIFPLLKAFTLPSALLFCGFMLMSTLLMW